MASSATCIAPASTKCVSSCLPSGSFGYLPGSIHMKNFLEGSSPTSWSHFEVSRSRSRLASEKSLGVRFQS